MMQTNLPENLVGDIELFSRNTDKVIDQYCGAVSDQETPELIYHYTDHDGLQGILKSGELWLTDILKLNDPSEIKFGIDHAVSVLEHAAANADKGARDFVKRFSATLQGNWSQVAKFYSLSFTEAEDDLDQWRAYASDGKGYVLAFDGKAIDKAFTLRDGNCVLGASTFPITYNPCTVTNNNGCDLECKISKLTQKIISAAVPLASDALLEHLSSSLRGEYLKKLSLALASPILHIATLFKHYAYTHEREYRFLQVTGANCSVQLSVRRRPNQIVEYATFDWRRFAPQSLRKIIVGPAADKSKADRFVEDCLRLYCGHYVDVEHSNIPYRSAW